MNAKLIARYAVRETMGLVVMAIARSGRLAGLTGGRLGRLWR